MTSYLYKPKNRRACRTYVVSDLLLSFFLLGGNFKILKFIFFWGGGGSEK